MPITFDSLEELQRFCTMFSLQDAVKHGSPNRQPSLPQSGGHALPISNLGEPFSPDASTPEAPRTRGRKSAESDATGAFESSLKEGKPRATKNKNGQTLTARIQATIEKFINKKQEFSANTVYQALAKNDPEVNKQSVITSVLKQMNSLFTHVRFEERPGNGPRPVKMYLPN